MEWIWSLFETKGAASVYDFKAAGCMFTDDKFVLAGYQSKLGYNISGFGGSRKGNETYMQTALRETIEELFELPASVELINKLQRTLVPLSIHKNGTYVLVHYSFEQLNKFLSISEPWCKDSPIYYEYPLTLNDLFFNRIYALDSEIKQLCLLPKKHDLKIDAEFLKDLSRV